MKILCLFITMVFLTSCGPHMLLVKDEMVTKQRLASSFVKSPDPERDAFKQGKRVIVEWVLPTEYSKAEDLTLQLHLVYGNLEEEVVEYPVKRLAGFLSHLIVDPKFTAKKGLLTYKAEIVDKEGHVVDSFKQHLWVDLIKHSRKAFS